MSETNEAAASGANGSGGPAEVPIAPTKTKKQINEERIANLKAAKARNKAAKAEEKAAKAEEKAKTKEEKEAAAPKKEKTIRACRCGCGGQTSAFFVPGHDARWKGWMKKIEKGEMEPKDLPPGTQKAYEFTPRGRGFVPTVNYNGNPYVPQCSEEEVAIKADDVPPVKAP